MVKDIENKIVVITGAARGIGFNIAREFLQHEAKHIVLLDINEELGVEAATTLNNQFGADKTTFFKCDVTTDLELVFAKILDKFKTFDILVNNAGLLDEYDIKKTITVNTVATVEWTMKFWDQVRKDKGGNGGTVINVASMYGYLVDPFAPFYKTSKYAVVGFTRTIGHKINYDQTGVRVFAICPGFTNTVLTEEVEMNENQQFYNDRLENFMDKNTWLEVDEVSKATAEIFKKAESGTAWKIIGGHPIEELSVPTEYCSEYLINGEI